MNTPEFKLSLCISTFNRASFIGATLESILAQLESNCEVVVVDGASSDNTEEVVMGYARRFGNVRYIKRPTNQGIDRDYDYAVQVARGEYCWMKSDDDLLKPGAIARVLEALRGDMCAVIVNMELRDFSLKKVIRRRWIKVESDRRYLRGETDRLFLELDYSRCG